VIERLRILVGVLTFVAAIVAVIVLSL